MTKTKFYIKKWGITCYRYEEYLGGIRDYPFGFSIGFGTGTENIYYKGFYFDCVINAKNVMGEGAQVGGIHWFIPVWRYGRKKN